jgi:hypothetical protein
MAVIKMDDCKLININSACRFATGNGSGWSRFLFIFMQLRSLYYRLYDEALESGNGML